MINKHDRCVSNCMIDGKQCTICWYVDDTKISHMDPKVVDQAIAKIEEKFGKMTVTRGKVHNFVGIDLNFRDNGTVTILMKEYIKECLEAYGEEIGKGVNTPAKHDLFVIDGEAKDSCEEKMDIFHHIVAKLVYVSKRAGVDIDLAISFLCPRVSKSTSQDWLKLRRLL